MSDSTPTDDLPTYSDLGANDILVPMIKAVYAALHIELIAFAIQWVLAIYGIIHYKAATPNQHRRKRRPYFILSLVMLALFTFATVADSIYFARLTINNPYRDYGMFLDASATPWYLTMGTVCNTIVILLGDGILVYRCYVIWHDCRWIIVAPCLALVGSLVLAVFAIITASNAIYSTAWVALSVTVNTMSTALIVGKLVYERRRLSKVLAHGHLVKYVTATAILVESAVPLTIAGIISSVILTRSKNMPLVAVVFSVWFCLSGLCPQLIIFRVAVGSSYPGSLKAASEVLSQPIQFAPAVRAVHDDSISDIVTNYSAHVSREAV